MNRSDVVLARITAPAHYWVDETHFLCLRNNDRVYGVPLGDLFESIDGDAKVVFRPMAVEVKRKRKGKEKVVVPAPPPKRARGMEEEEAEQILLELPPDIAVQILVQVKGVMVPTPGMRRWIMTHIRRGTSLAKEMGNPAIVDAWWREAVPSRLEARLAMRARAPSILLEMAGPNRLAYVRLWYPLFTRAYDIRKLMELYLELRFQGKTFDDFRGQHMLDDQDGRSDWILELLITHLRPTPIVAYSVDQRLQFQVHLREAQRVIDAFENYEREPSLRQERKELVFRRTMEDIVSYMWDPTELVTMWGLDNPSEQLKAILKNGARSAVRASFEAVRIIRALEPDRTFSAGDYLALFWLVEMTVYVHTLGQNIEDITTRVGDIALEWKEVSVIGRIQRHMAPHFLRWGVDPWWNKSGSE